MARAERETSCTVVKFLGKREGRVNTFTIGSFRYPEELNKVFRLAIKLKENSGVPVYIREIGRPVIKPAIFSSSDPSERL